MHWNNQKQILDSAIKTYAIDKWENQLYRPDVWIKKDALVGVIQNICQEFDVPYFSCRGYSSQSEVWQAGQRLKKHIEARQISIIIHLEDHNPSGIDMTRDNSQRLAVFAEHAIEIKRIALNYNQVGQYNPPRNPTKESDNRARGYIDKYGSSSWELDALEP